MLSQQRAGSVLGHVQISCLTYQVWLRDVDGYDGLPAYAHKGRHNKNTETNKRSVPFVARDIILEKAKEGGDALKDHAT